MKWLTSAVAVAITAACGLPLEAGKHHKGADIVAVEFLGTVDCHWYPESQTVLIAALTEDPREEVRYAAVRALKEQLSRAAGPPDTMSGWRRFPDPLILTQICRAASGCRPLDEQEMLVRYQELGPHKKHRGRAGDGCRGCCNPEVVQALARTAYDTDEFACPVEPSARVRAVAREALLICCQPGMAPATMALQPVPAVPPAPGAEEPAEAPTAEPGEEVGEAPAELPAQAEPAPEPQLFALQGLPQAPLVQEFGARAGGGAGAGVPILGRADTANRFNLFDNIGAVPRSRGWFGYQLAFDQNNALKIAGLNNQLFDTLDTAEGRQSFIEFTGFGRGSRQGPEGPGEPGVDPTDPQSADILRDQFLLENAGRDQRFLRDPDTHLYRFGFEYAMTLDFSVAVQAQYVVPTGDTTQPELWSNPLIMFKHVVYRDDDTVLSGMLGVQPQISRPKFAVGEDTSRFGPALLIYQELGDRWFTQDALSFNIPTESRHITTFDWALGVGYWLYRHESLERCYCGPKCHSQWLIGVIPQFEVLGKHVIGDTTVTGPFGLNPNPPRTAPGTVAQGESVPEEIQGTTDIYVPGTFDPETGLPLRVLDGPIVFDEPRHVIDLTFGCSFLFRNDWVWAHGVSLPVTSGTARRFEYLTTLNYFF